MNDEYIIVELIPNRSKRELGGSIVQVSCLKIKNLNLTDCLYIRYNPQYYDSVDLVNILNYGQDYFEITDYLNEVESRFKEFIGDKPLLIMDNDYTKDYLKDYRNQKKSIFKILGVDEHQNVFQEIKDLYHVEDTQDLVTILYEALINKENYQKLSEKKKNNHNAKKNNQKARKKIIK